MSRSRASVFAGAVALGAAASCTSLLGLDGSYTSSGEGGGTTGTGAGSPASATVVSGTGTGGGGGAGPGSSSSTEVGSSAGGSTASSGGAPGSSSSSSGGSLCPPMSACVEPFGEAVPAAPLALDMVASAWSGQPAVGLLVREAATSFVLDVPSGAQLTLGSPRRDDWDEGPPQRTAAFAGVGELGVAHWHPGGGAPQVQVHEPAQSDDPLRLAWEPRPPVRAARLASGTLVLTATAANPPKAPLVRVAGNGVTTIEDLCQELPQTVADHHFDLAVDESRWTMAGRCSDPLGVRVQTGIDALQTEAHTDTTITDAVGFDVAANAVRSAVAISRGGDALTLIVVDADGELIGRRDEKSFHGNPRVAIAGGRALVVHETMSAPSSPLGLRSCSLDAPIVCDAREFVLGERGDGGPVSGSRPAIAFDGSTLHLAWVDQGSIQRGTVTIAEIAEP